jgi:hypothetical protein
MGFNLLDAAVFRAPAHDDAEGNQVPTENLRDVLMYGNVF